MIGVTERPHKKETTKALVAELRANVGGGTFNGGKPAPVQGGEYGYRIDGTNQARIQTAAGEVTMCY